MTLKAYAVTCEKYYPRRVVYYAARTPVEATTLALAAIRRVGGDARAADLHCYPVPELDTAASEANRVGVLSQEAMTT